MTKKEFLKMDEILEKTREKVLVLACSAKTVVNFTVDAIKKALYEEMEED